MKNEGTSLKRQLLQSGVGTVVINSANIVMGFAFSIVLARAMGAQGYGAYSYTMALVTLLSSPACFGLPTLVERETARAHYAEDWSHMRGVWRWSNIVSLLLSLFLVAAAGLITWLAGGHLKTADAGTLMLGFVLVPVMALRSIRAASLRGLRKVVIGQLPEQLLEPAFSLAFVFIFLAISKTKLAPHASMGISIASMTIAYLIGAILLMKNRPIEERSAPIVYKAKEWLRSTIPMALINGVQLINKFMDIIMLGWFVSPAKVGVYRISVQISYLIPFGLYAVGRVVSPHYARLIAAGDFKRLQKVVTQSSRAILAMTTLIVVGLLVLGRPCIRLFFGKEYMGAFWPTVILAGGFMGQAVFGPALTLLNMAGYEREASRVISYSLILNAVLNLVLIPLFGNNGAATATAVTMLGWSIWISIMAKQKFGFSCSPLAIRNPVV